MNGLAKLSGTAVMPHRTFRRIGGGAIYDMSKGIFSKTYRYRKPIVEYIQHPAAPFVAGGLAGAGVTGAAYVASKKKVRSMRKESSARPYPHAVFGMAKAKLFKILGGALLGSMLGAKLTSKHRNGKLISGEKRYKKDKLINSAIGTYAGAGTVAVAPGLIRGIKRLPPKAKRGLALAGLLGSGSFAAGYKAAQAMEKTSAARSINTEVIVNKLRNLMLASAGGLGGSLIGGAAYLKREKNKKRNIDKADLNINTRLVSTLGATAGGVAGWNLRKGIAAASKGLKGAHPNRTRAMLLGGLVAAGLGSGYGIGKYIGDRKE